MLKFSNRFFVLLLFSFPLGNIAKCGEQSRKIDSLLAISTGDTNEVNALNGLSREMELNGDYKKGIDFADKAKLLAEKLNFKRGLANSFGNFGNLFYHLGNYPEALKDHLAALKIDEGLKNKNGITKRLGNIGLIYMAQADYSRALNYYLEALKIAKEVGNKNGMSADIGNIGIIYEELGSAEHINSRKKDGLFTKALDYYFRALKLAKEMGDQNRIANQLCNIGVVYKELLDYPKALDYFFEALKMDEQLNDQNGLAAVKCNIGNIYALSKKFTDAEKFLKEALALDDRIKNQDYTQQCERALSELYDMSGKYLFAFEHYKKYIATRDSEQNDENAKKQTRIEMQFEFDKKTSADSIRNVEQALQENLKHDQEIQQQKIYSYGGAIGFILMLIIAGISFSAYRQKQNANEIIFHQKELVEEKQKNILDSIRYAKRIQQSLLPSEKYIEKNLKRLAKGNT